MNQQNNEKDPGRRSGDRKQVFGGSNLIWSLIAVAVAGLFAASLFSNGQEVRLSYTDLERLIRVAGEEKDQSGSPRFVKRVLCPCAVPGTAALSARAESSGRTVGLS